MQHKDKELAKICEEKMKMVKELVSTLGGNATSLSVQDYGQMIRDVDCKLAEERQIAHIKVLILFLF